MEPNYVFLLLVGVRFNSGRTDRNFDQILVSDRIDRQTDRQTDKRTDGRTDGQNKQILVLKNIVRNFLKSSDT